MKRLVLRSWRVMEADPSGFLVWFDPTREGVVLYELEPGETAGVGAFREGDEPSDTLELFPSDVPSSRPLEDGLPF